MSRHRILELGAGPADEPCGIEILHPVDERVRHHV